MSVDVLMEMRSKVSLTSSLSPLNRLSRVKPTMNSRNRGDKAMLIDLGQPAGTSSNRILTSKNPPDIDSRDCSSQTMSLGILPPAIESTRFSSPEPYSKPMFASMRISRAMAVLRCPLESARHLSSAACTGVSDMGVTRRIRARLTLSVYGNHCWGAPRRAVSPPWCFTFPVPIQLLRTQAYCTPPSSDQNRSQSNETVPSLPALKVPTQYPLPPTSPPAVKVWTPLAPTKP